MDEESVNLVTSYSTIYLYAERTKKWKNLYSREVILILISVQKQQRWQPNLDELEELNNRTNRSQSITKQHQTSSLVDLEVLIIHVTIGILVHV